MMKIGTVKGRHDLPVEYYIFEEEIKDPTNLEELYEIVEEKLENIDKVELYVTGLTVVTTTVINYCLDTEKPLMLYHFDRETNTYYTQPIIE